MVFTYPVVFVDIETTGGGYKNSRVLEIAIIRYENGRVTDEFTTLIDPETYIPSFITGITGIREADVRGAPKFADIAERLTELFDGAVFVAHNVNFDYSFIRAEFARLGATFSAKRLCTVRLSRKLYSHQKGHSLEKLIQRHSIPFSKRHRALDDAQAIFYFCQLAYDEHGAKRFTEALTHQLRTQYTPVQIEHEQIKAIENTPGVYIFRDKDDVVLYVGKSVEMRKRVISHFQDMSAKEVKLAQQTNRIETIPTQTELLALLLESRLIKALSPVFNVQLRRMSSYCMVVREYNEEGYPVLQYIDGVPDERYELSRIYGMYETKAKAKKWLDIIGRTFTLCPKLLGLEKTKKACFNYSLGKCRGACIGKESRAEYEKRFDIALSRSRLEVWPYDGPVEIDLGGTGRMTVDKWTITSFETALPIETDLRTNRFDLDEYKILKRFLTKQFTPSIGA